MARVMFSKNIGWGFKPLCTCYTFNIKIQKWRNPHAKSNPKKGTLSVVGKTEDGSLIVSGVFELMSSVLGLPLEYILEILKSNNMLVSWTHFYQDSLKHCWKYKTTRERISTAVGDVYGPKYRDEVLKRLDYFKGTVP